MKLLPCFLPLIVGMLVPAADADPIEWINVGNPANAADANGYGAVVEPFKIAKHEVTNAEYIQLLNAHASSDPYGLYHPGMAARGITRSGSSGNYTYQLNPTLANRPVVYVSWFDAARYANWVANGEGSGDTETGSYTLNGATSGIIPVNPEATIFLPSENQWYKAAYYNGSTGGYTLYAHQSATISPADANYAGTASSADVGSFPSAVSFYGTLDQGGNVAEWNDSVIDSSRETRGMRGGSWLDEAANLRSSSRGQGAASFESYGVGFRLAGAP